MGNLVYENGGNNNAAKDKDSKRIFFLILTRGLPH